MEEKKPEEDKLIEQIILDLYNDKLLHLEDLPNILVCHSCNKKIKKSEKFLVFHDVHECINYVKVICWRESKKQ